MEKAIQKLLVAEDQGIEIMGECKNHMEVRGVNDLGPALIHPDFPEDRLAVRAVAVAAGVIVEMNMSAFGAFADVNAKAAGFAGKDSEGSLLLLLRLEMTGAAEILIRILPDFADVKVTQGDHLRSGQKGRPHFRPGKKRDGYRSKWSGEIYVP